MALTPNSTYAYVDLDDVQVYIETDDLNDTGAWSAATSYAVRDAVLYEGAHYVCLTANSNTAPSGNITDEWSTLALVRQGSSEVTAQEAYDLAEEALEAATSGTAYTGTVAQQGSIYSFTLFVTGTSYTDTRVVDALTEEISARIYGDGTTSQQGSDYAFSLFQAGTNYTDSRVLIISQSGSDYAFDLFQAGTNYTDVQVQEGSNYAANLFQTGIAFTNTQVQSVSDVAYDLYYAGTNYTSQQVQAGSDYALALFLAGTAATDAIQLTDAGAGADGVGLSTPRSGSNLPVKRLKSGQNVEVVSTGSNVEVSIQAVNTNTIEWSGPSVGQTDSEATTGGTLVLSFSGPAYTTVNLTENTHVSVTGMVPGNGISARLLTGGSAFDLTFQDGIRFVGERPDSLDTNKVAVLSLCSFGSVVSDVVAAFVAEQ